MPIQSSKLRSLVLVGISLDCAALGGILKYINDIRASERIHERNLGTTPLEQTSGTLELWKFSMRGLSGTSVLTYLRSWSLGNSSMSTWAVLEVDLLDLHGTAQDSFGPCRLATTWAQCVGSRGPRLSIPRSYGVPRPTLPGIGLQ